MTQQEFDSQLVELKKQKHADIKRVEMMQNEIKEEIYSLNRQRQSIGVQVQKLEQQRSLLGQQRAKVETEWCDRIRDFILQRPNCTSNLGEATTQNLFAEMRRRGFYGAVHRLRENGEEEVWPLEQKNEDGTEAD